MANERGLTGWVRNDAQGVRIEIVGTPDLLSDFLDCLPKELPPHSRIHQMEHVWLDAAGYDDFQILPSDESGRKELFMQSDLSVCENCLLEIRDPRNRRYRYPFTNCTHCGPRYSMMLALPYDRANTTMKDFRMCADCMAEFNNPSDRRFHAQPNACPVCGPSLKLWSPDGNVLAEKDAALTSCVQMLKVGKILAVKGLGGFHLMADAGNYETVEILRQRKHRKEKPFALMAPSFEWVHRFCQVSETEQKLLCSSERPIVLLKRTAGADAGITSNIAPGNPYLGVMLPYTPLHFLLLDDLGIPLIATSGNLSEEPICIDEHDALQRLSGIADYFLVHDRPIARPVDDSIARVAAGREMLVRRARGFAPLPIPVRTSGHAMFAMGGHLKNTVAISDGHNVFASQHLGDLETLESVKAFERAQKDLRHLCEQKIETVLCDFHPDYTSTRQAEEMANVKVVKIQHHVAHAWSCMADNGLSGPVTAVVWDGTGYGLDGTVWGGEFLNVSANSFERVGRFLPFPLPGSESAVRNPNRSALGLLYALYGDSVFVQHDWISRLGLDAEAGVLRTMLKNGFQCPLTSSVGRLFDGVAALVGLRTTVSFEAQAAMDLEFVIPDGACKNSYTFTVTHPTRDPLKTQTDPRMEIDWRPMLREILTDIKNGSDKGAVSAKFHNTLCETAVAAARIGNLTRVVLSGGCFQNKYLLEETVRRLRHGGFEPYWHQRVPANDGGISVGQIFAASGIGGL